jgi:hypothetical protein
LDLTPDAAFDREITSSHERELLLTYITTRFRVLV